ncbi:hypothetical protein BGX30_008711 [Mortierella sp. GBA39]|nr:hypothetical protein BGX30_008711 [Mortierella sp. GBA39]
MASADKQTFEKGAIVSADSASLIALAAEVAKHDEKFQRVKGVKGSIKVPRSVKKPTVWQRQNTGLSKRSKRHDTSTAFPDHPDEAQSARKAAMERKAKMYEMLRRDGGEGIPDNLREELLVEFDDPRRGGGRDRYRSGSEDEDGYRGERFSSRGRRRSRSRSWSRSRSRSRSRSDDGWDQDESMRVARDPRDYKDDPWVEHVDEFGRSRLVRQSEIPAPEPSRDCHDSPGIYNPANPFPVFRNQDAIDKEEWIKDATGEMTRGAARRRPGYSQANKVRHYDNTAERRARGVGFYAFSQDEEERAKQMRELLEMRNQTETSRSKHRTLKDKRREEIEARKILIQQKRLKSLASTVAS